jgi:hypothetical protein
MQWAAKHIQIEEEYLTLINLRHDSSTLCDIVHGSYSQLRPRTLDTILSI